MTTSGPKQRDKPDDDEPENDDPPERPDARLTFRNVKRIGGRGDRIGNSGP